MQAVVTDITLAAASAFRGLGAQTMETVWWILSVAMIGLGIAGTVLPALPGTTLVFAGIFLGAWTDGFARVSGWTVGVIGVLAVLAFAVDYLAAVWGAQRAGASRLALMGAAVGTVLGVFTGLIGLLFMPLAGAMLGEYVAQRRARTGRDIGGPSGSASVGLPADPALAPSAHRQAARVGLATWLGLLLGTVAKLVLVCLMVGLFVGALLI